MSPTITGWPAHAAWHRPTRTRGRTPTTSPWWSSTASPCRRDEFGTGCVEALFANTLAIDEHPTFATLEGVRVSAHLLISRRGRVTQFVPFDRRAWHAGTSRYRGRRGCNDFAIGIELEGTDATPYTNTQYTRLTAVVAALVARYPKLSVSTIAGHAEIAPGRKTDPGPSFDWPRLIRSLVHA